MLRITINPKERYDSGERVAAVAGILEQGDSRMEAKALVRKTFDTNRSAAESAILQGIQTRIDYVLSRL